MLPRVAPASAPTLGQCCDAFSPRARADPHLNFKVHTFLNKNLQVLVVMQKKMEVESSCGCKQEAEQRPEDLGTRRSGLDNVLACAQPRTNMCKHFQPKNKEIDLLKVKLDILCAAWAAAARRGDS